MNNNPFAENCQQVLAYLFEGMFFSDTTKLIQYWNPSAEKITGYLSSEVAGRLLCSEFLRHVDREGNQLCHTPACPLSTTLADGKVCEVEAYIHHKEGHRIPVSVRTFPLFDTVGRVYGAIELFRDNSPGEHLAKELAEVRDMATIDPLTGLRNRSYAQIFINSKLHELKEGGFPFGILFFDIDHFKHINDTYGHNVGDAVLKMIAKTLLNNTRESDVLVRWGGEEIVAVISSPDISRKLYKIAEKLRHLIRQSALPVEENKSVYVTVSIGATLAQTGDTVESLLNRADNLMYQAKKAGRNCVKFQL